jgi:hypothetical protein
VREIRTRRASSRTAALLVALVVPLMLAGCLSARVFTLNTFTSSDGRFHIDVPGGAMTDTILASGGAFARSTVHALHADGDGLRFAVVYGDADPHYKTTTTLDGILSNAEAGNVSSTGGTQSGDQAITIAGQAGREQEITGPSAAFRFWILFVGDRLYSLSVTGAPADVGGAEATSFFNSFGLLP